jgi:hypothetical protein
LDKDIRKGFLKKGLWLFLIGGKDEEASFT